MAISMPTDPRGQKLLIGAVLPLLLVAAYWYVLWKPDHAEVVLIAAHADTLETRNAETKKLVDNGEGAKIRAESERATAELAALRKLVPTQNEVPALIDAISTAARQAGMDISELSPDGVMTGDYFDAWKYKISVTGPYHKVAEFFANVGSLDRIVTPINVAMFPSGKALERKPGKNETFVDASFGVLTYVAKTVATPPPPAPPGTPATAAKPGAGK